MILSLPKETLKCQRNLNAMSIYEQDIILVEQLKAGSEEAFAELYNNHRKWLIIVALTVLGNKDEMEAQDLVQQFFIDFWERKLIHNITQPRTLKAYLHRSIYNRCLDRIESRKVEQKRKENLFAVSPIHQLPENRRLEYEDKEIEDKAMKARLDAAINEMPTACAKVFELAYLQHKNRNEIARELGTSPNTVKNQLVFALKILRKKFKHTFSHL